MVIIVILDILKSIEIMCIYIYTHIFLLLFPPSLMTSSISTLSKDYASLFAMAVFAIPLCRAGPRAKAESQGGAEGPGT